MSFNVKFIVNDFLKELEDNQPHRYRSWEICHDTFLKFENKKLTEEDLDYLALHLGFYLASWGMYRGSSFLLQYYDYTIHKAAVKIAMDYKDLFHINPFEQTDKYLYLLFDSKAGLYNKLDHYYTELRKNVKDTNSGISSTLITKILIGIFGCVPAYDRFFLDGITPFKISKTSNNQPNLKSLIDYIKNNSDLLQELYSVLNSIDTKRHYTIMKIIDMYFWQIGYKNNNKGEHYG